MGIQARWASECVNPGIHSLALRACIGKILSAARLSRRLALDLWLDSNRLSIVSEIESLDLL